MSRWLEWSIRVVGAGALLVGALTVWNAWEYGPNPPIPHRRVILTLPFAAADEATGLIPMGETIAHPFNGGHPGIDFQWDHPVPLIAVADGTVRSIARSTDEGLPVWDLTLDLGDYLAIYKELDTVADSVRHGTRLRQGDAVGMPHCVTRTESNGETRTGCQLHWEFGYDKLKPGFDRLCPLTHFSAEARRRIDGIWDSVPPTDQFKAQFPAICSNIYAGRDG